MSQVFTTARPDQQPEVFPLISWHNHPVYQGFYILRNGDMWIDVGSPLGHLGQYNVAALPKDKWIVLQDQKGAPLPVAVFVQRFGNVMGRWLREEGLTQLG
jgi:hypothetical protein